MSPPLVGDAGEHYELAWLRAQGCHAELADRGCQINRPDAGEHLRPIRPHVYPGWKEPRATRLFFLRNGSASLGRTAEFLEPRPCGLRPRAHGSP